MHIVSDVPTKPPKISRPKTPTEPPPEPRERDPAPVFYLEAWREHFEWGVREMARRTGIDPGKIRELEARAMGEGDIKNRTNGIGIGVLEAYRLAFGLKTIDSLRRRPTDPPTDYELFLDAPAEWRADQLRWRPPLTSLRQ